MPSIPQYSLLVVCAVAAFTDWRTGQIPNWLTLPPLVIAPIYFGLTEGAWGLARSLLGILICSLVPLFLFWRQAMGGGDVKLLAAIGAMSGYMLGLEIQLFACGLAAFYALLCLCWEGKLLRTLRNIACIAANTVLPRSKRTVINPELMTSVRFGGAIFCAAVIHLGVRTLAA
ncbi:MAG: prepilin peptidase [Myxococcales bacterium]|nr:prepilin peptidase [Myxococcales bacterium]MCB9707390.1 prepilin peptidase [Myxococcales bacterium]